MALWRTIARTIALTGVAVSIGLLPGAPAAHAAPSVDEIEKQLDQEWEKIEPVIEQYNKVHSQLQANQKKAADLQSQMQPLQLQVDMKMSRVGDLAAAQYKRGPADTITSLLESGSPSTLTEQLAMLDILSRDQRAQIAEVSAARDKYASEKQQLDRLVDTQKKQEADVAARRKQIQADIDKLEKQRRDALGSSIAAAVRIGDCPTINIVVKTACAQIGKPYVFGSTGPNSFDCSGLTQYAWKKAGVSLAHYTGSQWSQTRSVSRANAAPGDLVFFYSDHHHVGIYVGNGIMVHAPRTGKPVQMAKIDTMPIAGFRHP